MTRRGSMILVGVASLLGLLPTSVSATAKPQLFKFSGAAPGSAICSVMAKVSFSPPLTLDSNGVPHGGTDPSAIRATLSRCGTSSNVAAITRSSAVGSYATSPYACMANGLSTTGAAVSLTISWKARKATLTPTVVSGGTDTGSFAGPTNISLPVPASGGSGCTSKRGIKRLTVRGTITLGATSGGGGGGGGGLVSGAFDLGWDPVGSSAPFTNMSQDFLFALQTENGSGLDSSELSAVPSVPSWVAAVHAAHDLAIITIGGSSDQNWQYACSGTYQSAFVSNLINFMVSNGFDGVDIDMEDDAITAEVPPVALWTGCAEAIIDAAHAATTQAGRSPIVSEDVITNWEGPWIQPYQSTLDQINLMTYGDTCSSSTSCASFASDIADTVSQLCPSGGSCDATTQSKFVLGLDMNDYPGSEFSCGYAAGYAKAHGYRGAFDWDLVSDEGLGGFPCQTAIEADG